MSTYTKNELQAFHASYMETAIWSSNDTDSDTPEQYHLTDDSELSEQTQADMLTDCRDFLEHHAHLIDSEPVPPTCQDGSGSYAMAGHDFWLTRCGHGAGFWDGDWPVNGDALTDASKAYGNVDLMVGDDGLVYS